MEWRPTRVIHIKDTPPGWRDNPEFVYIGRGSKWGNPFSHKQGTKAEHVVASREEAITEFKRHLTWDFDLYDATDELQGKTLVCYCKPLDCHGDVLAAVADGDLVLLPRE